MTTDGLVSLLMSPDFAIPLLESINNQLFRLLLTLGLLIPGTGTTAGLTTPLALLPTLLVLIDCRNILL